ALIWRTSILKLHPLLLEDINNTSLFIDIPTRSGLEKIHSGWRIVDSNNEVLKSVEPSQDEIIQQFSLPIAEMMPYFRLAQDHGELLRLQLVVAEANNPAEAFDIMQLLPELDLGDTVAELRRGHNAVTVDICWQHNIRSRYLHLCLWPADQPWVRTPVAKPIANTESGQATVTVAFDELPGEMGYRGTYVGQLAVIDPWLATHPERPTLESAVLQIEDSAASQYYLEIANKVTENRQSVVELLTLLAFYGRKEDKAKWHDTNGLLYKAADCGNLSVAHLLLWLESVRANGSAAAYKRLTWMIFDAKYLADISFDQLDPSERAAIVKHFPGNKPSPHKEHLIWLLDHNIGELRQACLVELCQAGNERGFEELLEVFAVGLASDQLIARAVASRQIGFATFLLNRRTQPAAMLLRTLVDLEELSPFWLQEGVTIHMDRGVGLVTEITDMETGEISPCCLPNEDCQVAVELELNSEIIQATLSPADQRLILHTVSELKACSVCGQLGLSDQAILAHYDDLHPAIGQRGIKPVPPGQTIRYSIHSISAPIRENL
ncbi:MAG: hypothetical protein KDE28_28895, partial [Anaerolineales bacterium]|nr:hypothetical protein [Anaerolineales bacterium]